MPDAASGSDQSFTISGTVRSAGKTFAIANDKSVWTITNPEALLDSIGDGVRIRAFVDAAKHEIQIISVGST